RIAASSMTCLPRPDGKPGCDGSQLASPSEGAFVGEAVIFADHRHVRIEAELTRAERVLAAPLRVSVAEQLVGAARVQGIVGGMVHLTILVGARPCWAQNARADAEPVLAEEYDPGRAWDGRQRPSHHDRIAHVAHVAVRGRDIDAARARPGFLTGA